MAIFRKIHVTFWSDPFVQSLTPEQKYFYLYLMTNEKTQLCGIYEISPSQMSFDTGYNSETVKKLIEFFSKSGKVMSSKSSKEVAIKNWPKYNFTESPQVKTRIQQEFDAVKDKALIEYLYSIDTPVLERVRERTRGRDREEKDRAAFAAINFVKPTTEDIINYLTTEKNLDDFTAAGVADNFWHFYESKGWKVGKNPMKVWRSAVSGWILRNSKETAKNNLKNDSSKSLYQKHVEANKKLNDLINAECNS